MSDLISAHRVYSAGGISSLQNQWSRPPVALGRPTRFQAAAVSPLLPV